MFDSYLRQTSIYGTEISEIWLKGCQRLRMLGSPWLRSVQLVLFGFSFQLARSDIFDGTKLPGVVSIPYSARIHGKHGTGSVLTTRFRGTDYTCAHLCISVANIHSVKR